jgi:DUF4097 and DUF4098 domain-containing protein YvlB
MAAAPEPGAAMQEAQDFRWTGRIESGKTLEIRGVNGEIQVERAAGAEAEVVAHKTARRSDPAEVEIVVVPHEAGVTICAVYPAVDGRENECEPGGGRNNTRDNDVEVEWTVKVPDGVKLGAHTVNGDVTVRDVGAEVRATTVNGDVDVTTRGVAEATTVNGSIRAALGRSDWTGRMEFTTVNGGITVEMPDGLNATVEASTVNGDIETDFPITVRGRFGSRTLRGTIGEGGRDLELETVNGSIRLVKS